MRLGGMPEGKKTRHGKNKTWDLVRLLEGKKPVGCRWVFNVKYKPDGSLERYKVWLVAKGYTQIYGNRLS